MADDNDAWKFMQAEMPAAGPSGAGIWYHKPAEDPNLPLTNPPTDGSSGPSIEDIHTQIMNQHPEDISALADQWYNAWYMLFDLEEQLLKTTTTLADKHWKDGEARNKFLEAGPGKTLASLRQWQSSMLDNVFALRTQVFIVRQARTDMANLFDEYQKAIKKASETDGTFWTWVTDYNLIPGGDQTDYNNANKRDAINQVNEQKKIYAARAQQLAWNVAQQIFTTYPQVNNGHGAPFFPMNALMTPIGASKLPGGAPGGPPGGSPGAPGGNPQVNPPNAPNPQALQQPPPNVTAPDPNQVTPPAPQFVPTNLPAPPPVTIAPPVSPPVGTVPPPPPAVVDPNAVSPSVTGPKSPSLLTKLSANTTNLSSGLIQNKGFSPPSPEMPPGALRSPGAAPPPPVGNRGKTAPAGSQKDRERGGTVRQPAEEESFGRTPSSTSPPVLNNQRPGGRRPGSREELNPTAFGRPGSSSPLRPAGAAPPVLNSPGQNAMQAQPPAPARPTRSTPTAPGKGGAPGRPAPSADWVGVDEARADASAPVLDAPEQAPAGPTRLDEVKLRGRASSTPATGGHKRPASTVSPELTARRARHEAAGTPIPTTGVEEEGQRIVTDEQAFSVDTPGGGVVTKQPEDKSYRVEPPAALGGT